MQVNKTILEAFECQVCTEPMSPPMKTCLLGHSFCSGCAGKMTRCPNCREPIAIPHNYHMEHIYNQMQFPCRNRAEGCAVNEMGLFLKDHEEFCSFAEKRCPLGSIYHCSWTGQFRNTMQHCLEQHPKNAFALTAVKLSCSILEEDHFSYFIFEAYGGLFQLRWDVCLKQNVLGWHCAYLGDRRDAYKYHYGIEVIGMVGDDLLLKGQCQPNEMNWLPHVGIHLEATQEVLKKYCRRGQFIYNFTLYRKYDCFDRHHRLQEISTKTRC